MSGTSDVVIRDVAIGALGLSIKHIIAVRTSAYEPWNGRKSTEEQELEAASWLEKIPERTRPAVFVAQAGDELIGYLWGYQKTPDDLYISHIGVRPEHARRGIGTKLIRASEALAIRRGYSRLSTSTYNRFAGMLTLLISEGFQIEGTTRPEGKPDVRIELAKRVRGSSGPSGG